MLNHMYGFMPLTFHTWAEDYIEFSNVSHSRQVWGTERHELGTNWTTISSENSDSETGKLPGVLAHWNCGQFLGTMGCMGSGFVS